MDEILHYTQYPHAIRAVELVGEPQLGYMVETATMFPTVAVYLFPQHTWQDKWEAADEYSHYAVRKKHEQGCRASRWLLRLKAFNAQCRGEFVVKLTSLSEEEDVDTALDLAGQRLKEFGDAVLRREISSNAGRTVPPPTLIRSGRLVK